MGPLLRLNFFYLGIISLITVVPFVSYAGANCSSFLKSKADLNLHRDGVKFLSRVQLSDSQLTSIREAVSLMSPFAQIQIALSDHYAKGEFGFHKGEFSKNDFRDLDQIVTPYGARRLTVPLENLGLKELIPHLYEIRRQISQLTNRKIFDGFLVSLVWGERLRTWSSLTAVTETFDKIQSCASLPIQALPKGWNVMDGCQDIEVFVNLSGPGINILTKDGRQYKAAQGEPVIISTKETLTDRYQQAYPLTAVRWNEIQDGDINLHFKFSISEEGPLDF